MSLSPLGLDRRTTNALRNAGYAKDPSSIGDLTIEGAFKIRGFGRRCLEILLYAAQDWHRPLERKNLDRSDVSKIRQLKRQLHSGKLRLLKKRTVPSLPVESDIEDFIFDTRIRNCLGSCGIRTGAQLSGMTFGELLAIPSFGIRCAASLLESIERVYLATPPLWQQASECQEPNDLKELAVLRSVLGNVQLKEADVRFGEYLRRLRTTTSAELIKKLEDCEVDANSGQISALLSKLQHCRQMTLEDEAVDLRRRASGGRDAQIIRGYFGFGGVKPKTLAGLGDDFGVTRERIRQIANPKRLQDVRSNAYLPAAESVEHVLLRAAPARSAEVESNLQRAKLIEVGTSIGGVLKYLTAIGSDLDLEEINMNGERTLVSADKATQLVDCWGRAERLIARHAATTAARVRADSLRLLHVTPSVAECRRYLELNGRLRSVGEGKEWFVLAGAAGEAFSRRVRAVLSIAGSLTAVELRNALRRDYREGWAVPPSQVLKDALCDVAGIQAVGDRFTYTVADDNRLPGSSTERRLLQVLRRVGGVCERRRLQALVAAEGVRAPSFWRIVNYSPCVCQLGRGVYGLIGTRPPPGLVAEMREAVQTVTGGLVDRGWDSRGRLWLAYRLSPAAVETGIFGVPAPVRGSLADSYRVSAPKGADATIRLGDAQVWGLRSVIDHLGGEPGDYLVMRFDLRRCEVSLELGGIEMVERCGEEVE